MNKGMRVREYFTMYQSDFLLDFCTLYSAALWSFHALSAAGHAGGPPVHHGARLGPGRTPWRVLWSFKVVKSGK